MYTKKMADEGRAIYNLAQKLMRESPGPTDKLSNYSDVFDEIKANYPRVSDSRIKGRMTKALRELRAERR